jgi:DNA-binding response OmpR family regulator
MARILVIDDDPTIRSLCALALQKHGHAVECAADGRDGMAMVADAAYDLVITDLVMPEQEGISTIRHLQGVAPRTPILAISGGMGGDGQAGVDYLKIALAFGAQASLRKPFSPRQLAAAVDELLRQGRPAAASA